MEGILALETMSILACLCFVVWYSCETYSSTRARDHSSVHLSVCASNTDEAVFELTLYQ